MSRASRTTQFATSLAIVVAVALTAVPGMAAGARTRSGGPATSHVYNTPAGVDVVGSTYYTIRSDQADVGTYHHAVDSVVSQFQSSGSYELSTLQSATRSIWLDLCQPVDPAKPAPAAALGGSCEAYVPGRFITMTGSIDLMKGVGSTLVVPLPFVFNSPGNVQGPVGGAPEWQLRMNAGAEEGTTNAVFTCTSVVGPESNTLCNAWTAEPVGGIGIGKLVRQEVVKGKTQSVPYGYFHVTFRLAITKP